MKYENIIIRTRPRSDSTQFAATTKTMHELHPVFRASIIFLFLSFLQSSLAAQEWASKMFKTTSHDFGTVARDADAVFEFEFENIYEEDVRITGVRSNCGCTIPSITKKELKTWDKSVIVAKFNTHSFTGARKATLTVAIDKPFPAEVQLNVKGVIRGDVVFDPGSVDFGTIKASDVTQKVVRITRFGNPRWEISDVLSYNQSLSVGLKRVSAYRNRVLYEMAINLKPDCQPGAFDSSLILVTNDRTSKKISVPVRGNIEAPLALSPDNLDFGTISPNKTVSKKVFVKGTSEFEIIEATCADERVSIEVKKLKPTIAILMVEVKAAEEDSPISDMIHIKTNFGEKCLLQVPVRAEISAN